MKAKKGGYRYKCPQWYEYEEHVRGKGGNEIICEKYWNREIPVEQKELKIMNKNLTDNKLSNQEIAWEYARKLLCEPNEGGYDKETRKAVFGTSSGIDIIRKHSAKEVIEGIDNYFLNKKLAAGDIVLWDSAPWYVIQNCSGIIMIARENIIIAHNIGDEKFKKVGHINLNLLLKDNIVKEELINE